MSVNYAAGLSSYDNKGKLGTPELYDSPCELNRKVNILTKWVQASQYVVAHTGAGVSTAAGIPDFRGPKGVWTLEAEGKAPSASIAFDDATPTFTHMALMTLERRGIVKYLITQNVDGLHMRSGFPRDRLSELHGNVFIERCSTCLRDHVRPSAINSVGQKPTGRQCLTEKLDGRQCRGKLKDTVLDWEAALPKEELTKAEKQSALADLSICFGSTLQIVPAGTLPVLTKKNGGLIVIVNLQQTKQDKNASLIIHARVDDVMRRLMLNLGMACEVYRGPAPTMCSLHGAPPDHRTPTHAKWRRRQTSMPKEADFVAEESSSAAIEHSRTSSSITRRRWRPGRCPSVRGVEPSSRPQPSKFRGKRTHRRKWSRTDFEKHCSVADADGIAASVSVSDTTATAAVFTLNANGVVTLEYSTTAIRESATPVPSSDEADDLPLSWFLKGKVKESRQENGGDWLLDGLVLPS